VVDHLERLAAEDGLKVRLRTRVDRIDRDSDGWSLRTPGGDVRAEQVVVATGYEHEPVIPSWPGRDRFERTILHSADYRDATPFAGREVLVVGPGCSGMEIAHDLVEGGAARVWLAVRTPPNILLREAPGGIPGDVIACALWRLPVRIADAVARLARRRGVGDLTAFGLPVPDEGAFSRAKRLGVAPTIVDAEIVAAIRAGRIEVVGAVESLDRDAVNLAGDTRIRPDAIICATGFRRALEPLVGHLGVLGERGLPHTVGATSAAEGLRFIGYVPRPGGLGHTGQEARRAARAIARELRAA
jgi:cation diffusion facilitator CzcD-associated flavoprotein CzcO